MISVTQPAKAVEGKKSNLDLNYVGRVESSLKRLQLFSPICEMLEKVKNEPEDIFLIPSVKEGSFGFVYGPAKSGKTIYTESWLLHCAAGRNEFMGAPLNCTKRKCLFISLEEGGKKYRYQRNGKQFSTFTENEQNFIVENNNYMVTTAEMPPHIVDKEGWMKLERIIEESEASIVAIDSLNRLTADSNADEVVAKGVSKQLQSLVTKYPITLIVINHTTKASSAGIQTVSSMSGSRIYGSDADFMIAVNRTENNARYVKIAVSRYGPDDFDTVDQFEITDNQIVNLIGKVPEQSLFTETDGRFNDVNVKLTLAEIETICQAKGGTDFSTADLTHLWKGDGRKFSKQAFYKILERLSASKKIEDIGNTMRRLCK